MRLLLVEDDPLLGAALESALRLDEFVVDWARTLADARSCLRTTPYGIVLLDRQLPDGEGLHLLTWIRQQGMRCAVLVLTAADEVSQRVRGLDAGADDYLVKPFDLDELRARLRVAVRRLSAMNTSSALQCGEIRVDLAGKQVFVADEPASLSVREYTLLVELLSRRGYVLSRQHLEDALYAQDEEVESNAIEVYIHHLRRKLGAALIRTVRGQGYIIDGDQ